MYSLLSSVKFLRPDLLQNVVFEEGPISLNPPEGFFSRKLYLNIAI